MGKKDPASGKAPTRSLQLLRFSCTGFTAFLLHVDRRRRARRSGASRDETPRRARRSASDPTGSRRPSSTRPAWRSISAKWSATSRASLLPTGEFRPVNITGSYNMYHHVAFCDRCDVCWACRSKPARWRGKFPLSPRPAGGALLRCPSSAAAWHIQTRARRLHAWHGRCPSSAAAWHIHTRARRLHAWHVQLSPLCITVVTYSHLGHPAGTTRVPR